VRREALDDRVRIIIPVTSAQTGDQLPGAVIITAHKDTGEITARLGRWSER
jgi:hypothetical protein